MTEPTTAYRVLVVTSLYAIVACNFALYIRHQRRFQVEESRPIYPVSWMTRAFRYVMTTAQLGVIADVPLAVFGFGVVPSPARLGVTLAIGAGAIGLLAWSLSTLGEHFAPCYDARLPTAIVETGPYRFFRHPIYLSNTILLLAFLWGLFNALLLEIGRAHV